MLLPNKPVNKYFVMPNLHDHLSNLHDHLSLFISLSINISYVFFSTTTMPINYFGAIVDFN